jgi:hypothetical protein
MVMTEQGIPSAITELSDLVLEAIDALDTATDDPLRAKVTTALGKLEEARRAYDEALRSEHRALAEQRFGRRIVDLTRQAAQLPAQRPGGTTAVLATDHGVVPFIENRATQSRTTPKTFGDDRLTSGPRIGGEIEAWCGPCGGLTTHHIVAMVGSTPKQVICQSCQRRHNYRTTPARGDKTKAPEQTAQAAGGTHRKSRDEQEADRRAAERRALREELMGATNVKTFDPKQRYKPGEIIQHPEHGRGKVENVLRRSMLVRFEEGLRPVDLA